MMGRSQNNLIQAIIFDLGRVLVQVNLKSGLLKEYFGVDQAGDQEILEKIFKNEIFISFSTGKINPPQFYQLLNTNYKLNISYDKFVQEWCAILSPMAGMAELVAELSGRYTLGILSDTDPLHWQYCLQQFSFLHLFASPTLSYQTGFLKPDPHCFSLAAQNTGGTPVEGCLFIDDREENVNGSRKAGMKALQFTDLALLRRELNKLHIL
jgi:HAD superfamily hydrolase (TIGR01509 family)